VLTRVTRLEHAGGAPAQRHLSVAPALDVAGVVAADRDHRLLRHERVAGRNDPVGRAHRSGERGWHAAAEHGEGLGEALAQARGGAGVGLVQLAGERLELASAASAELAW